jgi:ribose 1,5-bisphosphate isomerase
MWAGVSGYMETNDLDQAYAEIKEETGLGKNDIELKIKGSPLKVVDNTLQQQWIIHPFLFRVKHQRRSIWTGNISR